MRVFITGSTRAIGSHTVPALVAAGHDVSAMARGEAKAAVLASQGASPIRVSLFDRDALTAALHRHDAVVNLASALPSPQRFILECAWTECKRIRTEGSATVVDAAHAAAVPRVVQELVSDATEHFSVTGNIAVEHFSSARGRFSETRTLGGVRVSPIILGWVRRQASVDARSASCRCDDPLRYGLTDIRRAAWRARQPYRPSTWSRVNPAAANRRPRCVFVPLTGRPSPLRAARSAAPLAEVREVPLIHAGLARFLAECDEHVPVGSDDLARLAAGGRSCGGNGNGNGDGLLREWAANHNISRSHRN
jgi:hypothetical protein